MSEPTKSPNGRPGGKNQPDRFQPKLILFYLAIAAVIFVLWAQTSKGRNDTEISMYEVVLKTQEGLVDSGSIIPNPSGGSDYYNVVGMMQAGEESTQEGAVYDSAGVRKIRRESGEFDDEPAGWADPVSVGDWSFVFSVRASIAHGGPWSA